MRKARAAKTRVAEDNPVSDVRRIRERRSAEAGHDIARLIESSRQIAEPLIAKLGLKRVKSTFGEMASPKSEKKNGRNGGIRKTRLG